jgi:hypothetical protein
MQLSKKKIKKIFDKYKNSFEEMEHYDRTREILWKRSRIDLTLNQRTIKRLREMRAKTGKPISHIVEEAVSKI